MENYILFKVPLVQFSPFIKLATFQGTRYTANKVTRLEGHLDLHPRHLLCGRFGSGGHTVS